jgi:uncharacterized membrane protein YqjE
MPIGPQPRRARGTVGHPYSALNLRLVLACFGLLSCTLLALVLAWMGYSLPAAVAGVFAVVAVVDIVVIQIRRRRRRVADGGGHSLFE